MKEAEEQKKKDEEDEDDLSRESSMRRQKDKANHYAKLGSIYAVRGQKVSSPLSPHISQRSLAAANSGKDRPNPLTMFAASVGAAERPPGVEV